MLGLTGNLTDGTLKQTQLLSLNDLPNIYLSSFCFFCNEIFNYFQWTVDGQTGHRIVNVLGPAALRRTHAKEHVQTRHP